MKFDEQVKEAKSQRYENKIIRDVILIVLGILFLIITFITSYNNDKNDVNNKVTINQGTKKTIK